MKLTIEVKNNKFFYEYSFESGERQAGDMPFGAEHLIWFSDVLRGCQRQEAWKDKARAEEIMTLGYIETHPEIIERYLFLKESREKSKSANKVEK